MKKIIILTLSTLVCISVFSQVELTLHVENAGELENKILASGNAPQNVSKITLSGWLNGTDIRLLRYMGGANEEGTRTEGYQLAELNLKNARIVAGGDFYYQFKTYIGGGNYETHYIETNGHRIREYSFIHCGNLTEITIPDSITYIGKSAFENCSKLSGIHLPNEVNIIEPNAFYACQSLTSFIVPDSVTSIGAQAFRGSGLKSIQIPDKVTNIGNSAFAYCKSLATVDFPASVTSIAQTTFFNCDSLKSFVINDSITSIGSEAFRNSGLTSISIPKNVSFVGNAAFGNCLNITNFNIDQENKNYTSVDGVFLDKNQTKLIQYPVGNMRSSYTVPETVDSIYNFAFANCSHLVSVNLSEGVSSIGDYAFHKCSNISTLHIPASVTAIGADAFSYCGKIDSVYIPLGVKIIKNNTFKYCEQIKTLNIPYTVTSIGDEAFSDCTGLTRITLSGNLNKIGYGTFLNCTGLLEIISKNKIPPSVPNSYTFGEVNRNTCVLTVPPGSKTDYMNAPVWNEFMTVVEADIVASIGNKTEDAIKIYTDQSYLVIESKQTNLDVLIYSISGALITHVKTRDYCTRLPLKNGVYLVRAGNHGTKIIL